MKKKLTILGLALLGIACTYGITWIMAYRESSVFPWQGHIAVLAAGVGISIGGLIYNLCED